MKDRPYELSSKTYKIKPPVIKDAIYITLVDAIVGGVEKPVEIFINCKNMQSFQWVSIMTRLLAFEFSQPEKFDVLKERMRKVIQELKDTYDTGGGYFIPNSGGKKANSIVAHIGTVLEDHCRRLRLLPGKPGKN